MAFVKRILVGRPLATTEMEHQRIPKTIALAVFSSDAISSTAYATEEILFVVAVGASSLALGLNTLIPIGIAVAILLTIVVTSYRQTIFAYPSGGGSYVVSRENLGENPSLVAGASLLVDYILTVAVSISAGVAAIVSIPAFHGLAEAPRRCSASSLIALISLANLRGIKESGRIFAVPTYIYIVILAALVGYGLYRSFIARRHLAASPFDTATDVGDNLVGGTLGDLHPAEGLLVGRGRAHRCRGDLQRRARVPPPGVEERGHDAGVDGHHPRHPVHGRADPRPPPRPVPERATDGDLAAGPAVFGSGTVLYVVLQFATAAILTLAANTAYADFPRLSSIIAHDGYLPRQLANRGDRLVFSNGVLVLAGAAGVLIIAFGGLTNALIPLYAVGVFLSFTLSQAGMVRHHQKEQRERATSATS